MLTGAGLSTDSGIPDYRGPAPPPRTPMTYQEFIGDPETGSATGPATTSAGRTCAGRTPTGPRRRARLEQRGLLTGLITQNVDRLHEDAGSVNVVDLHGRFDQVVCLDCRRLFSSACWPGSWRNSTRVPGTGAGRPGWLKWPPTPMPPSRIGADPNLRRRPLPRLRRNPETGLRVFRRKCAQGPRGARLRHG